MNTLRSKRWRWFLTVGCLVGADFYLVARSVQAQDAPLPPREGEIPSQESNAGLPLLPKVSGRFAAGAFDDLTSFAQSLPISSVTDAPRQQAERLVREARQHHIANHWRAALDATGAAIAADPTCVEAYEYRAELYAEKQLYAHAIATLTDAIATRPEVVSFWGLRGQYRCFRHDPGGLDDIDEASRRAGEFSARLGWLRWLHAISLGQIGDDRACVAELDAIMTPSDDLETDYQVRGTSLLRLREWDRALADFERAAELKPNDKQIYYRGMARLHAGRFAAALADYEQARLAYPKSVYVQAEYGLALCAAGRVAASIRHLDALLTAHPDDGVVQTARGWVALLTGEWEGAHTWLAKAADQGAGRFFVGAFTGWPLTSQLLDPILADFEARCRVVPDLPFACSYRPRAEARTSWTPDPVFSVALVCRRPFGANVAPPLVFLAMAYYPEQAWRPAAHLGEFSAAASLRDGTKFRQAITHVADWFAYDFGP